MPKTTKIMSVTAEGRCFYCTFTPSRTNAYVIYQEWYENGSKHRKKMEEYCNFVSVLYWLTQYAEAHRWGYKDVWGVM